MLVGTAQRLVRGGWLFGTVILVTESEPVRSVLVGVYRALGLEWNPATVGAVQDTVPAVTVADVRQAVLGAYATWGDLQPGELPADVLADAEGRSSRHLVPEPAPSREPA
jgi:hypothetical protein